MRIQARRLAPKGMSPQSVAAAGVDVERREAHWNGEAGRREAATAADSPAERREQAIPGGEASDEATSQARAEASAEVSIDPSNEAQSEASAKASSDASREMSREVSREVKAEANAAAAAFTAADQAAAPASGAWHGDGLSRHQGSASAPLKIQRGFHRADGRCELPLLHTAGGLVGGDRLSITVQLEPGSRALLTSVAAQKVYGSIGRSRLRPEGAWALQDLAFELQEGADLEWLPQELVLYADGLYEQRTRVTLAPTAGWLGAELVRLGRTAAGENLGAGRWRSLLEIRRRDPDGDRWELVDRLELGGSALVESHGLAGEPVFGSLVWAAPRKLVGPELAELLEACRGDRAGLEGTMACGALEQGLVARYRGPSSMAARSWFTRLWARIRATQGLAAPELPRVWPFQERPFAGMEARGAAGEGRSLVDRR